MQPEAFIIWLQGYIAACGSTPTEEQINKIVTELNNVQMRGMFRRPSAPQQ